MRSRPLRRRRRAKARTAPAEENDEVSTFDRGAGYPRLTVILGSQHELDELAVPPRIRREQERRAEPFRGSGMKRRPGSAWRKPRWVGQSRGLPRAPSIRGPIER